MGRPVEPRCTCGHPAVHHDLDPSMIVGACNGFCLNGKRCRCTAYVPLADPPRGLAWR